MNSDSKDVKRFVTNLNAAFGSRMTNEARELYYQELRRWFLTAEEWELAIRLITGEVSAERVPPLADIYEYLKRAQQEMRRPHETQAVVLYRDAEGRSWCSRPMDVESANRKLDMLPEGATDAHVFPLNPVDSEEDMKNNPDAYPAPGEVEKYLPSMPIGLLNTPVDLIDASSSSFTARNKLTASSSAALFSDFSTFRTTSCPMFG